MLLVANCGYFAGWNCSQWHRRRKPSCPAPRAPSSWRDLCTSRRSASPARGGAPRRSGQRSPRRTQTCAEAEAARPPAAPPARGRFLESSGIPDSGSCPARLLWGAINLDDWITNSPFTVAKLIDSIHLKEPQRPDRCSLAPACRSLSSAARTPDPSPAGGRRRGRQGAETNVFTTFAYVAGHGDRPR